MANLNVSYDELQNASHQIVASRDNIYSELDQLRSRINELTSSGFVTERTSAAFNDAFEKYNTGAKQTIEGLDDVVKFLNQVQATLQETDAQLAAALG